MIKNEPPFDKTNKVACAPSEDSDQPGHPPSLIRVFAVRMKKAWVASYGPKLSSCGQRGLWSDWADAQVDLSLRWVHSHIVGFVMRWLILMSFTSAGLKNWRHASTNDAIDYFYFVYLDFLLGWSALLSWCNSVTMKAWYGGSDTYKSNC